MADDPTAPCGADLAKLLALVERLRAPDGCPWDRKQTLRDVRAYLLEEAHETAAALDDGDWAGIREELGDLLFQVAFVLRLAEEEGAFAAAEAVDGIHAKMVARHPHVFGDEELADADAVHRAWEERKAREKPAERSILDGVAPSLPALLAAYRMTQKAAGVGFDWPDAASVLDKIREETAELEAALAAAGGMEKVGDEGPEERPEEVVEEVYEEVGDLLFTVANLARKLGFDPEAALAAANAKFRRRFRGVEEGLAEQGLPLADATLDEMEELWRKVKGQPPLR